LSSIVDKRYRIEARQFPSTRLLAVISKRQASDPAAIWSTIDNRVADSVRAWQDQPEQ
jgi:hypothetical protein